MKFSILPFLNFILPISVFSVSGKSMEPTVSHGTNIIVIKFVPIKVNDIIICRNPLTKRLLVKRVREIKNNKYFVIGDNKKESSDSRDFGWITRKAIVGKVIYPRL